MTDAKIDAPCSCVGIKKRCTPESAAFWEFVERTAREWRELPAWAREMYAAERGPQSAGE